MLESVHEAVIPSKTKSLARAFSRLGWAGLWIQILFGSIPIAIMVYYFAFSTSLAGPRGGFPFVEYLAIFNLLILALTTVWSYRYTRLAKKIVDPEKRPAESHLRKSVWAGVVLTTIGMLFSMIVMLIEAGNLLFYFLKAPQGGIPVVQTSTAETIYFVSSVDMLSLMSLILMLFAELVVLVFGLWLLFRTSLGSHEYPHTDVTAAHLGTSVEPGQL